MKSEQADLSFADSGTCPCCGASTTRDPGALVQVEYVDRYPLRKDEPKKKWVPCDIEHCTACEWTLEHSRGLL